MVKYSFLEPIQIGPLTLRNRVVLGAMAKYLCSDDGFITDEYCAHYARIAEGGCSLITPGIMVIDPQWPYKSQRQPYLSDDKYIPGIRKFAVAVHRHGAKAVCQLWHPGLAGTMTKDSPGLDLNDFSLDQIEHIQEQYFQAARRCREAGADGVDFHMAHTYLPSQFLSPYFNRRTDRYGSNTIENATRFSVDCIGRIKRELCRDNDFIITSKINGSDFIKGGTTPPWAAQAAALLEKAGVDMITVNGGGVLTKLIGMSDDGRQPEGWKIPFAETVKQAVTIPVAGSGSLRHPQYVDSVIRAGKCDLVSLARGLFAEPDWVGKCAAGREKELRCCISCMFCFTPVASGLAGCSVNPFAKRELARKALVRDGAGRRVAVVGAGPSGLEAAVTLAERGFAPVIFEKEKYIGGLVALAKLPPNKVKLGWMIDYYRAQIERLGIEVLLETKFSKDILEQFKPYAVVVAAGSRECRPPIDGLDGEAVVTVRDVLKNHQRLTGKKIVILGGGLTGLETARLLFHQGNEVTVLEMLPLNPQANIETRLAVEDARAAGITLKTEHQVKKVSPGRVLALDITAGREIAFEADLVVLSLGIISNRSVMDEIGGDMENIHLIGDAATPGKISSAVQAGSDIGYGLK
ncbi:MAG: NAD(P)/FAD-dependent oxidoreductase [Candidatus Adiutrix sp.]|jgi:2,4-dienoyl-CoA reductase-like NADH-dependent reductase (Old Yellow Enzyme family)/thioredoxin reductase|nr:NAD(P)/FAD-dependent oxidoreductase [Candidatus Adiutrix sp.]